VSIPRTHTYRQTQTQTRTHTIRNAKPPSPFPLNKHANTRTHAHTHTRARSRTHIHTRRTRERMHPDRDTRTTHTHTHARLRLPASWCTVAHSAAGGSARPSAAILAQMWGGGRPMDGLPKCSAQFAGRCFGVRASLRTSASSPTGSIECTARASTPRCATPPAADHRSDLGCSREGAANT
jgi:hypothetical protein